MSVGIRASVKRWIRYFTTLIVVFAISYAVTQGRRLTKEEAAPIGKYTARQAIQRTENLIRSLTDSEPGLLLSAEPQISAAGAPDQDVRWVVKCTDAKGTERAIVSFDANTSRIRGASRHIRHREAEGQSGRRLSDKSPDSERRAVQKAVDWLISLGSIEGSSRWEVRGIDSTPYIWTIRLENSGRKAIVKLDRKEDRVVSAYLGP